MTNISTNDFWRTDFGSDYTDRNNSFDREALLRGWAKMISATEVGAIKSVLECVSNLGRNLQALRILLPESEMGLIEINEKAFRLACEHVRPAIAFNGALQDASLPDNRFDLVFTVGLLIHIHPNDLDRCMDQMYRMSRRYILIAEYFNRTPVSIPYRGHLDKLFKCDFGKKFLERRSARIVDYGFLWGHEYDRGGFDDITWWLFEKNSST